MKESQKEYWKKYFDNDDIVNRDNLQKNVSRTKHGVPVDGETWEKTIQYIQEMIHIDKSDTVVELACGNGLVIGNLADKCKKAIGVDYSKKLLAQLETNYGDKVEGMFGDIMDVSFEKESLDIVIIYFSIQVFSPKETILLIQKILNWLKPGGKLFIGDVTDELKKWKYIDKSEYRKDYFQRVINDTPLIGYWFQQEYFIAMKDFFENITVKTREQPDYQINSLHSFDVLIEKKSE